MNPYYFLLLLIMVVILIPSSYANIQKPSLAEQCTALEDDNPQAAIKLATQQLELLNPDSQISEYGHFLGCLGWSYATNDEIPKARTTAFELKALMRQARLSAETIKLIRRAGAIYHRIGNRISAVEIYQDAMKKTDEMGLVSEQIPLLINLGVLNSEIENHETAIDNYYAALTLMDETDDFRYQPPVLYNLANTLRGQKRHDEALKIYKMTEDLITAQWPNSRKAQIYFGMGATYYALDDLTNAAEYLSMAEKLTITPNEKSVLNFLIQLSQAVVDLKQNPAQDYNELADQAHAFFLLPENAESLLGHNQPLLSLAYVYELQDRHEDALSVLKFARKLEQKFQKTFNKDYMAQMQNQLSESQAVAELALQGSEQVKTQLAIEAAENQKNLMLLTGLFILILFLLFLFWQFRTNRKLIDMARTDSITQIGNRRSIEAWQQDTKFPSDPQARYMWLIDLDNFKIINDEHDHDVGDTVLRAIAKALNQLVNKQRSLCRWGGEEFMLLTDDLSSEEKDVFSEALLKAVKHTKIKSAQGEINLTASIGISQIQDKDRSSWRRAIYEADKALYSAKDRGRNCAVMATRQA